MCVCVCWTRHSVRSQYICHFRLIRMLDFVEFIYFVFDMNEIGFECVLDFDLHASKCLRVMKFQPNVARLFAGSAISANWSDRRTTQANKARVARESSSNLSFGKWKNGDRKRCRRIAPHRKYHESNVGFQCARTKSPSQIGLFTLQNSHDIFVSPTLTLWLYDTAFISSIRICLFCY